MQIEGKMEQAKKVGTPFQGEGCPDKSLPEQQRGQFYREGVFQSCVARRTMY